MIFQNYCMCQLGLKMLHRRTTAKKHIFVFVAVPVNMNKWNPLSNVCISANFEIKTLETISQNGPLPFLFWPKNSCI